MVHSMGGPESLGLTGLLERMYHKFIVLMILEDAKLDSSCKAKLE
jgi:hypothetical protein